MMNYSKKYISNLETLVLVAKQGKRLDSSGIKLNPSQIGETEKYLNLFKNYLKEIPKDMPHIDALQGSEPSELNYIPSGARVVEESRILTMKHFLNNCEKLNVFSPEAKHKIEQLKNDFSDVKLQERITRMEKCLYSVNNFLATRNKARSETTVSAQFQKESLPQPKEVPEGNHYVNVRAKTIETKTKPTEEISRRGLLSNPNKVSPHGKEISSKHQSKRPAQQANQSSTMTERAFKFWGLSPKKAGLTSMQTKTTESSPKKPGQKT